MNSSRCAVCFYRHYDADPALWVSVEFQGGWKEWATVCRPCFSYEFREFRKTEGELAERVQAVGRVGKGEPDRWRMMHEINLMFVDTLAAQCGRAHGRWFACNHCGKTGHAVANVEAWVERSPVQRW